MCGKGKKRLTNGPHLIGKQYTKWTAEDTIDMHYIVIRAMPRNKLINTPKLLKWTLWTWIIRLVVHCSVGDTIFQWVLRKHLCLLLTIASLRSLPLYFSALRKWIIFLIQHWMVCFVVNIVVTIIETKLMTFASFLHYYYILLCWGNVLMMTRRMPSFWGPFTIYQYILYRITDLNVSLITHSDPNKKLIKHEGFDNSLLFCYFIFHPPLWLPLTNSNRIAFRNVSNWDRCRFNFILIFFIFGLGNRTNLVYYSIFMVWATSDALDFIVVFDSCF